MHKKKNPNKDSRLETAVLETLKYRAVFNSAMSYYQLSTQLVGEKLYQETKLLEALENLEKKKKIDVKNAAFSVPGTEIKNWKSHYANAVALLETQRRIIELIGNLKWVLMVGLTGSVAAHSAKKKDDLDILIVTEHNRMWLARLYVVILLKIAGVYPKDDKNEGKICPNIFLSESSLAWDADRRNIYTAHEVILLQPLVQKNDTYLKFLEANAWALEYFPNFVVQFQVGKTAVGKSKKKYKFYYKPQLPKYESVLVDLLESCAKNLQLLYMKKKRTTERVEEHIIHFNKHDHTPKVLSKFGILK